VVVVVAAAAVVVVVAAAAVQEPVVVVAAARAAGSTNRPSPQDPGQCTAQQPTDIAMWISFLSPISKLSPPKPRGITIYVPCEYTSNFNELTSFSRKLSIFALACRKRF